MTTSAKRLISCTLCALFAALIVVGAYIRVPLPAIPFTLQAQFVLLAGLLLGGKRGALSVLLYLVMGLAGLPVFAGGGGLAYVLKPSFGYLIGFMGGALLAGWLANRVSAPSYRRLLAASFAGLAVIYVCGMVYFYLLSHLYLGTNIGVWSLLVSGFFVTLPGDTVLCVLGVWLAQRLIPILRRTIG